MSPLRELEIIFEILFEVARNFILCIFMFFDIKINRIILHIFSSMEGTVSLFYI